MNCKMISDFDNLSQTEKFTLLERGGAHLYGLLWSSKGAAVASKVRQILPLLSAASNIPPIKGNNEIELAAIGMQNIGDYTMVVVDPRVLGQLNAKNTDYGNRYLEGLQANMEKAFGRVITLKEGSKRIFMIPDIPGNKNPARSFAEMIESVLKQDIYISDNRTASEILGLRDAGCCLGATIADINRYTDLRNNRAYSLLLANAREGEGVRFLKLNADTAPDMYSKYPELVQEYMIQSLLIDPHEFDHQGNIIALDLRRYAVNLTDFNTKFLQLADLIIKARTTIPLRFNSELQKHPELSKESIKMLRMINAKSFTCGTVRTTINNKKVYSDIYNLEGWIKLQDNLTDIVTRQVLVSRTGGDEFMINVWTEDHEMIEVAIDLSGVGAGNAFMGRENTDRFIFAERARYIIEEISEALYRSDSISDDQLIEAFSEANRLLHEDQLTISKQAILEETRPDIGEYIWKQLILKHYEQDPVQDEKGDWQITINTDQYFYMYNKIKVNDTGYTMAYQILSRYLGQQNMPSLGAELKIDLKEIPLEAFKELVENGLLKQKHGLELRGVILPANIPMEMKRAFSDNLVTLMKSANLNGVVSWRLILEELLKQESFYNEMLGIQIAREFLQINSQIDFLSNEQIESLERRIRVLEQRAHRNS